VRVGIVGCGAIAPAYLSTLAAFPELEVQACASRTRARAEALAARFGVGRVLDVAELVEDPAIDIVVNLTDVVAHAEVTLAAIRAGKSVYSEKPLASTLSEAAAILEAAGARSSMLACAPDTVLGGPLQECRALVERKALGEPIAAFASGMLRPVEHRRPDPEKPASVGPWKDLGPYALTAIVEMLGPVTSVRGTQRTVRPLRQVAVGEGRGRQFLVEAPTLATAILELEGGAVATLVYVGDAWGSSLPRLEIYGTEGTLRCPAPGGYGGHPELVVAGESEWGSVEVRRPLSSSKPHGLLGIGVIDLVAALREGRRPRAAIDVAYHVVEVLDALERSDREARAVPVTSRFVLPPAVPSEGEWWTERLALAHEGL
jgi:predicted dehydrogenase